MSTIAYIDFIAMC